MRYRDIQAYYDNRYNIDGDEAFAIDEDRLHAQLAPLLKHLSAGAAILDVGCGVGFACALLAQRGYQVWGTDISTQALSRAQTRVAEGTFLRASEDGSLPFADGSFDGISCIGVLEHIPQAARVLEECHRVLRSDGVAVFVVPNARSPYFLAMRGTGQLYEQPRTRVAWEQLFTAAGLIPACIAKDPGPRLSRRQPLVRNMKIVAHRLLNQLPLDLTYQFVFELRKT